MHFRVIVTVSGLENGMSPVRMTVASESSRFDVDNKRTMDSARNAAGCITVRWSTVLF